MIIPLDDLEAFYQAMNSDPGATNCTKALNIIDCLNERKQYTCTFNDTARVLVKMGIFGEAPRAFCRAKSCLAYLLQTGQLERDGKRLHRNPVVSAN